jgi:hypothetical protein
MWASVCVPGCSVSSLFLVRQEGRDIFRLHFSVCGEEITAVVAVTVLYTDDALCASGLSYFHLFNSSYSLNLKPFFMQHIISPLLEDDVYVDTTIYIYVSAFSKRLDVDVM